MVKGIAAARKPNSVSSETGSANLEVEAIYTANLILAVNTRGTRVLSNQCLSNFKMVQIAVTKRAFQSIVCVTVTRSNSNYQVSFWVNLIVLDAM